MRTESLGNSISGRFVKGAVFGITVISLVILAAMNLPAQTPTRKSEPRAKILVGEQAKPAETGMQGELIRPPQPLSLEEKRRFFRSVTNSLAEQSKLYPGQNLGQVFSPNVWKPNFNILPSPPTLTTRQTWIDNVGWLDFRHPEYVSKQKYGGKDYYLATWNGAYQHDLTVNLNAVATTYLLDFAVGQEPSPLKIVERGPSLGLNGINMQIDVAQGHLLVPLLASSAGWYEVTVSCPQCEGWTFFSVEINQVK